MGKAGRAACVFTPMALSIATLVCLILVGLGGTDKNNGVYNSLYFFRADTSNIDIDASLITLPAAASNIVNKLGDKVENTVKSSLDIQDLYHVSLWNYCSGSLTTNSSSTTTNKIETITFCSPRTNQFWFNPVEVWGLNNSRIDSIFPSELRTGLNTYRLVAKWMFISYIVTLVATIVEIVVGLLALFTRLGSMIATIVSSISSLFIFAFAVSATALYATLAGLFNTALGKYNVHASLGRSMYIVIWMGLAFSFAASICWSFSSCCCSGRSNRSKKFVGKEYAGRHGRDQPTSYDYSRMDDPYANQSTQSYNQAHFAAPQQSHQMAHLGPQARHTQPTSYEPFRHG